MANGVSMPIGMIGGNNVELIDLNAKVRVTNPAGKSVTIAPDEFLKQVSDNAENVINGEDFEFKSQKNTKTKKALKILGAAAATAAVATTVIYRKEIAKYMKDFSFKKLWQDIKNLFGKKKVAKEKASGINNVYTDARPKAHNASEAKETRKTLTLKEGILAAQAHNLVEDFERMISRTRGAAHNSKQKMYEKLFAKQ